MLRNNVVKRESGESPEQTRCCKLNQNPCAKLTNHCLASAKWEGRTKDEQVRKPARIK